MSQYLVFRKNGINLISYCRNSELYAACVAPYDKFAPITNQDWNIAESALRASRRDAERIKERYEARIKGSPDYAEIDEWYDKVDYASELLVEIDGALHDLEMLRIMSGEEPYLEGVEEEENYGDYLTDAKPVMEWGIF